MTCPVKGFGIRRTGFASWNPKFGTWGCFANSDKGCETANATGWLTLSCAASGRVHSSRAPNAKKHEATLRLDMSLRSSVFAWGELRREFQSLVFLGKSHLLVGLVETVRLYMLLV